MAGAEGGEWVLQHASLAPEWRVMLAWHPGRYHVPTATSLPLIPHVAPSGQRSLTLPSSEMMALALSVCVCVCV